MCVTPGEPIDLELTFPIIIQDIVGRGAQDGMFGLLSYVADQSWGKRSYFWLEFFVSQIPPGIRAPWFVQIYLGHRVDKVEESYAVGFRGKLIVVENVRRYMSVEVWESSSRP